MVLVAVAAVLKRSLKRPNKKRDISTVPLAFDANENDIVPVVVVSVASVQTRQQTTEDVVRFVRSLLDDTPFFFLRCRIRVRLDERSFR